VHAVDHDHVRLPGVTGQNSGDAVEHTKPAPRMKRQQRVICRPSAPKASRQRKLFRITKSSIDNTRQAVVNQDNNQSMSEDLCTDAASKSKCKMVPA